MGVVIESDFWEPNPFQYIFIFLTCVVSILLFPYFSRSSSSRASNIFDHSYSSSLLRCQRIVLFTYSLASVTEGVWSVLGEFELSYYGVSMEQMVVSVCVGYGAALILGTFLGVLGDIIGQKKVCLIFWSLHIFVGIWKGITKSPSLLVASICLSLATSIFLFSFETQLVIENEMLGHRQDTVNDMFWLMTFLESASFIGSQVLANWLAGSVGVVSASPFAAIFIAIMGSVYTIGQWTDTPHTVAFKDYRSSFSMHVSGDKRIWLLACAQACLQFSTAVFWFLWAPTLVADGREVHLGLLYPCLLGARMLGSSFFPWLNSGLLSLRTEDYLVYAFITMGLVLSIIAYDYQEIGVLVTLFCLFHACVGLVFPSLAKLKSMYVPNGLRGGMTSVSSSPANAAILLILLLGAYYRNIANAVIMGLAAIGLFSAAGCMYVLKQWSKQPYPNSRKL